MAALAVSVLRNTAALRLQLYEIRLPHGLSSMDYGNARSYILLHFRCIVAGPAASAILNTAGLQLQLSGLQLPCSFILLHFRCTMAAPVVSAL